MWLHASPNLEKEIRIQEAHINNSPGWREFERLSSCSLTKLTHPFQQLPCHLEVLLLLLLHLLDKLRGGGVHHGAQVQPGSINQVSQDRSSCDLFRRIVDQQVHQATIGW